VSDRNKYILMGAVAGAVLGAATAYAYYQSQESGLWLQKRVEGKQLRVKAGTGDLVKIGLAVLGVVRQIRDMAKEA